MADVEIVGTRSKEEVALELVRFIWAHTAGDAHPKDENAILGLYEKCKASVYASIKPR